jgi:hypothetical protein
VGKKKLDGNAECIRIVAGDRILLRNMSDRFLYVRIIFLPKSERRTQPTTQRKAVIEVPKELVQRKQAELIDENPRVEEIALRLARKAALDTFSSKGDRVISPHDEDVLWYENRHHVMDERPCDQEVDGTKVWIIRT